MRAYDVKKILVVDDEQAIVKVVKRRLESSSYEVITASDGAEGLQKALAEKPDLIISDVTMPNMDGYTFVNTLRGTPEGANIPVIILTVKEYLQDLFKVHEIKYCDYLFKPFKAEELLKRVDAYLRPEPGIPPPPVQ